ncbi:hypothetical protein [Rhodanobacter sp. L36]|uniref:hypothetical protein n=1 Tax=Rhodanobacter sp. L36 TaxID=1747221 RepID=UPI001C2025F1|nr:hypothetical protein [Rhodanobacter sp. L36]
MTERTEHSFSVPPVFEDNAPDTAESPSGKTSKVFTRIDDAHGEISEVGIGPLRRPVNSK